MRPHPSDLRRRLDLTGFSPAEASAPDTFAPVEIGLHGVRKRFSDQVAVDGISLNVHEGEFFSVLGPRSSGGGDLPFSRGFGEL